MAYPKNGIVAILHNVEYMASSRTRMINKEINFNKMNKSEKLLRNIDWESLRKQKSILVRMIMDWGESNDETQVDDATEAEGILQLIDSIQDHAVDDLGLKEGYIFGDITINDEDYDDEGDTSPCCGYPINDFGLCSKCLEHV